MEQKYIIALEIGSSKLRGAVGQLDSSGTLSVKAVEEEQLIDSVRYGCIQNVAEVSNRIQAIISRLESRIPGHRVTGVYVGVGGKSTMATRAEFERQLPLEREITKEMVEQINEEAYGTIYNERDVISVTPREYRIDRSVVARPVGTYGRSIQATLNLITCRSQIKRNLNQVLSEKLHLNVNGYIVRQLAQADLVLSSDEKRLGCMLVDFGAETTTVSIYKNGALQYLATLPLGSRNITRDITSLNHLEERAEQLKLAGGNADPANTTTFTPDGIDYTEINNYVTARAGEIIANINEQIKYAGFTGRQLPAGIIVVGNGAKLRGFNSRLEAFTKMKVRAGMPVVMIRIGDPRIHTAEAVDVISVLYAATLDPMMRACTIAVIPKEEDTPKAETQPDNSNDDDDDFGVDEDDDMDIDDEDDEIREKPRRPSRPGIFTRAIDKMKNRVTQILTETDDDDNDDLD